MPDGQPLPDFLFDFTEEELSEMKRIAGGQDLIRKVLPAWKIKGAPFVDEASMQEAAF